MADRKSSSRRIPIWSRKDAPISRARFRVMPLILVSNSGCSSSTVKRSAPNSSTSRRAVAAPTPLRMPEDRYSSMAFSPAGTRRSTDSALNCSPYEAWRPQVPVTVSPSPGATPGIHPTTVTGSGAPTSRRRTV